MVDRNLAAVVLMLLVLFLEHDKTESLTLQIEGNKTSFTFPSETTSEIKFYVFSEKDFRIYVQHKAVETNSYNTMCFVDKSASRGCFTSNNICRCPKDTEGAFSLNKTFQESDAGLWMFRPWQHDNISKTVNVSISEKKSTTWAAQSSIQTTPELATSHLPSRETNSPMTSQASLTTRVTSEVASSPLTTVPETTLVGGFYPSDLKQKHKKPELNSGDIASMVAIFVFTLVIIITLALDIFLWLNPEVDMLERCRQTEL